MTSKQLNRIISDVKAFPSMSGVALKVLKIIEDPKCSASDIEALLRYDPSITANILKITNSAYFGIPTKIASIRQAVVLLGWKKLGKLVMTTCVNAVMDKPVPGYDLSPGELWQHSIAVSVAADILSKELGIEEDDEVFTAALLHDLGKLVLGAYVKSDFAAIERAINEGTPFQTAEREVLGTDHAEVGGLLLETWAFPESLVQSTRWHHDPDSAEEKNTIIDLIHIADVLCLMMGIGVGTEGIQYQPSPGATKRLGLKPKQLELVASQTLQWAKELGDVFLGA